MYGTLIIKIEVIVTATAVDATRHPRVRLVTVANIGCEQDEAKAALQSWCKANPRLAPSIGSASFHYSEQVRP